MMDLSQAGHLVADKARKFFPVVQHATNGTLASFTYAVGIAGNRTNLIETVGGASRTNQWDYDALYRLTNEIIIASQGANGSLGYGYDEVGNRTNRNSTVAGVTNQTFTYSANDWLDSDGYDGNGNTTNSVKGVDTYDYENRLIRRETGTNVIEIAYDGDGHRVRKSVITGGETNTVWYLVDDRNHTGYAQVLEEMQLLSGQLASTRVYSYGHDLIAQEQVISNAWVVSFYGYDGHGSVRYLSDDSGAITDTYAYDAYGILTDQTMGSGGATPNLYLYTGEQFDPDLGFCYLRARYNNPQTGRFWTMDAFEGWSGRPISFHKYLYTHANPVNGIDPSGRFLISFAIGSIGAFGERGEYEGARSPTYVAAMAAARQVVRAVALVGATLGSQQTEREDRSQNSMRLQLQEGDSHYWSAVMFAKPDKGVTSRQVRAGLTAMHGAALADVMLLPFPDGYEPSLFSAIILFSQKLTFTVAGGGVTQIGNVMRETFVAGGMRFRIDLENLNGHNLRQ